MTTAQIQRESARGIGEIARAAAKAVTHSTLTKARLIGVFERAAVYLRLCATDRLLMHYLCDHLRPQDLEPGNLAIVWPTNETIGVALGLRRTGTKDALNRLVTAGFILLRRSANGRRYGFRASGSPDAPITSAFGIDLSPLIERFDELVKTDQEGRSEQRRRDASWAEIAAMRRDLRALLGNDPNISNAHEIEGLIAASERTRRGGSSAEMDRLEAQFKRLVADYSRSETRASESCETGPQGPVERPCTQLQQNPDSSFVKIAQGESSNDAETKGDAARNRGTEQAGFKPAEAKYLFPSVDGYLPAGRATWTDLDQAAARLQRDLGISPTLYQRARRVLSPPDVIISVFLTAQRLADGEIRSSAGSYFNGIVQRSESGQLDLSRTIHGRRSL